ncbi:MAG: thioredoxin [Bacteroidetes bacterium]|nr:thioredoxin [Rhodothermia bacterium]MCS7154447.1 thioredoxin [Bacteroidota bacterium]MCX7906820.1 thioredoxin [Bacteroidota bacterium]MDW8136901.1 thioredoxin [Bacteroidota bacterium]MDW8285229.1 thioredoxin [Bacteroidota bacterium]
MAARTVVLRCPICLAWNRVDLDRLAHGPKCHSCSRPLRMELPHRLLDTADFERIITEAQVPVLVDLYADWCGPCKVLAPVLDEVARDGAGRLLVLKVNVDYHPQIAARYGVQGVPTLLWLQSGREQDRLVGFPGREALFRWVQQSLGEPLVTERHL